MSTLPTYTVLSGGIGGAKLVLGLQETLAAGQLQVIANTGDDFRHLGLPVCPDIDTLLYTLSGNANPETGWGRRDESWAFLETLGELGGETWFRIGDRDLATHIYRRALLDSGLTLSAATDRLAAALQVPTAVYPMSDDRVSTLIDTPDGTLEFQDYFVRQQAKPVATAIRFAGSATARPSAGALQALTGTPPAAVIVSPSNPWLSIDPLLSVAGIQSALRATTAPIIAVSPIVGGRAIKGPAAKLMSELGLGDGVMGIAEHYRGLIDGLVIDQQDEKYAAVLAEAGLQVSITDTIMNNLDDKKRLAEFVVEFAGSVEGSAR